MMDDVGEEATDCGRRRRSKCSGMLGNRFNGLWGKRDSKCVTVTGLSVAT